MNVSRAQLSSVLLGNKNQVYEIGRIMPCCKANLQTYTCFVHTWPPHSCHGHLDIAQVSLDLTSPAWQPQFVAQLTRSSDSTDTSHSCSSQRAPAQQMHWLAHGLTTEISRCKTIPCFPPNFFYHSQSHLQVPVGLGKAALQVRRQQVLRAVVTNQVFKRLTALVGMRRRPSVQRVQHPTLDSQ